MWSKKGGLTMRAFTKKECLIDNKAYDYTIAEDNSFYLELQDQDACINIKVKDNVDFQLFIQNRSSEDTKLDINVELSRDANCQIGFLDLEQTALDWNLNVVLCQEGASFEILSGQLCMPSIKKKGAMEVTHKAPHTYGEMRNFAVLSSEADYEMVANGNIEKGCNEAQSHQTTRVLTLGKDHKAKVIPLLLIDENDVKASHALSIGQPDEDQLYYLQSRGLSNKQAMGLLSVGYFLPIIDLIDDQDLHDSLRQEMEVKVGLYGNK